MVCIALGEVRQGCSAHPLKPISWRSLRTVLKLIWRPHEVWTSAVIDLCAVCTSFSITFTMLQYHQQSTVECLVVRKCHDWTCCMGGILSHSHAVIQSSREWPILSHMSVEAVCMPRCLITCGQGTPEFNDFNRWLNICSNINHSFVSLIVYIRAIGLQRSLGQIFKTRNLYQPVSSRLL